LLGEVACTIRGVEDFVVEHREVEGKTKADWVHWGNSMTATSDVLASCKFSKVAVVITHPERV
jgi:aldehyde:ferredoxin oxidoreductase